MKLRASQSFSYPSFEVKIINIYTTLPRVIGDDFFDDDYIYIYIYIFFFLENRDPKAKYYFIIIQKDYKRVSRTRGTISSGKDYVYITMK